MKATKKNIQAAVKAYLETNNLTQFCKAMKLMGITKRLDITRAVEDAVPNKSYCQMFNVLLDVPGNRQYHGGTRLHRNLDSKPAYEQSEAYMTEFYGTFANYLQAMRQNAANGTYVKVLIEGDNNIYWASPWHGHKDYNKSVWRENTPENRRRAAIINAYVIKAGSIGGELAANIL